MALKNDWDPSLYLRYGRERTRPAEDLISSLVLRDAPERILDVGCGPGNSSRALLRRWPDAKVTGVDSSPKMIQEARTALPDGVWIVADAEVYTCDHPFDLVFSNAAIQWIADHERLLERLSRIVNNKGALAVQIPLFDRMPLARVIQSTAEQERWRDRMRTASGMLHVRDENFYYRVLSGLFRDVDLWTTDYHHVMPSREAIVEWIRSTGMRPCLDALPGDERPGFEAEVLKELRSAYPDQPDGKVLFPFKRLFMVGYR